MKKSEIQRLIEIRAAYMKLCEERGNPFLSDYTDSTDADMQHEVETNGYLDCCGGNVAAELCITYQDGTHYLNVSSYAEMIEEIEPDMIGIHCMSSSFKLSHAGNEKIAQDMYVISRRFANMWNSQN